jgi:DNA-binding NarL/FixJ family response regulator
MERQYLLDISNYQQHLTDFVAVARDGYAGVIVLASDGDWRQPYFAAQLAGARRVGLMVAAYHYQRENVSAQRQIDLIASRVPVDVPVIIDVEHYSGRGVAGVDMTRSIVNGLRAKGYRVPLVYIPRWYWTSPVNAEKGGLGYASLAGLPPLWVSRYPDYLTRPKEQGVPVRPGGADQRLEARPRRRGAGDDPRRRGRGVDRADRERRSGRERAAGAGARPPRHARAARGDRRRARDRGGASLRAGADRAPERAVIRLALADDHDLVLDGLRAALASVEDVEIVGCAHDGIEALRLLRDVRPDVAILDVHMPRRSGLDVARAARHEGLPTAILMVTSFDDEATWREALALGVRGFLGKTVGVARLLEGVRALARGETFHGSASSERARAEIAGRAAALPARRENPLTPKEREVLRLIATGASNREIADQLGTAEGTVKNHTSSILTKLDVRDRTRAVLVALRDGWI